MWTNPDDCEEVARYPEGRVLRAPDGQLLAVGEYDHPEGPGPASFVVRSEVPKKPVPFGSQQVSPDAPRTIDGRPIVYRELTPWEAARMAEQSRAQREERHRRQEEADAARARAYEEALQRPKPPAQVVVEGPTPEQFVQKKAADNAYVVMAKWNEGVRS